MIIDVVGFVFMKEFKKRLELRDLKYGGKYCIGFILDNIEK